MNRRLSRFLPALLAVPVLLAGCGSESTALPPGLGPVGLVTDLAWPAACESATGTGDLAIGDAHGVFAAPSYTERHARGCVPYDLATIWQVLQIPTGIDVAFWPEHAESDCAPQRDVEPGYAVSFLTKEIPHGGIQSHYTFDVTWRIDVTAGTAAAPTEVKVYYGKTAGTTEVPWLRGSVVFTTDPNHAGWTRLEMVRQLNTNGHSDDKAQLQRWLQEFHDGLEQQLATGSLSPRYCVLQ
jgi:hypothetical protein